MMTGANGSLAGGIPDTLAANTAPAGLDVRVAPAAITAAEVAIPSHVPGIDGVRGLAALTIVFYHIFTSAGMPEYRPWGHINLLRPLHDGWAAVNLFLVLSGFCLFWPYARRADRQCHYAGYMLNRIRRIVPAYYFSLLFVPAIYIAMSRFGIRSGTLQLPSSVADVVKHLLLLHSLTTDSFMTWNGVTWSLGLEWTWYLAFPVAVWLFRRVGAGRGLLTLMAITTAYRLGLYWLVGPAANYSNDGFTLWARVLLPGRLTEFGLGMYTAAQLAKHYSGTLKGFVAPLFGRPLVALGLSLVMLVVGHMLVPLDSFLPFGDAAFGAAFALLIVAVVDPSHGLVRRACSGRLLDGIGQCSYSLFLLHLPIAAAMSGFLRLHGIDGPKNFVLTLTVLPLMIVVASLSYRFIEAPFLRRAQIKHVPAST